MRYLLIMFLLIGLTSALSENFQVTGKIDAWQDGPISMRVSGEGIMDYGAERYSGGLSSGLTISNGTALYSFRSEDYAVRLDNFTGSIITESDAASTTVDGNGVGTIKTRSYENSSMGALIMGFPSGELYGQGVWTIKASSARATPVVDPMETNATDGAPSGNETVIVINKTMEI
jgi:hypothetical protein